MVVQMKKIFKTSAALIALSAVLLLASCGTGGEEPGGEAPLTNTETVAAKYQTVPFKNAKTYTEFSNTEIKKLVRVTAVGSAEELEGLNLGVDFGYDEAFFGENSLLLFRLTHYYTEKVGGLSALAIKNGALYPVVSISPKDEAKENIDHMSYTLISAEVKKADINMPIGKALVIVEGQPEAGNQWHGNFDVAPEAEDVMSSAERVAAKYQTVPFENPKIYTEFYLSDENLPGIRGLDDITVINSLDELSALGVRVGAEGSSEPQELHFGYDEAFFNENALVLVSATFNYYYPVDELCGLTVKDGALCPVISYTPAGPGCDVSTAFLTSLAVAEVKKAQLPEKLGEILVINNTYPDEGSDRYVKFE